MIMIICYRLCLSYTHHLLWLVPLEKKDTKDIKFTSWNCLEKRNLELWDPVFELSDDVVAFPPTSCLLMFVSSFRAGKLSQRMNPLCTTAVTSSHHLRPALPSPSSSLWRTSWETFTFQGPQQAPPKQWVCFFVLCWVWFPVVRAGGTHNTIYCIQTTSF